LLFLPLQILMGQDKIITIQQDAISCRIISTSSTHIQYEQNMNGYMVGKFILTEQVSEYYRSPQISEPKPYDLTSMHKLKTPKSERRWVIGIYPGRASMLASTTNDESEMVAMGIPRSQAQDYNKQRRHGWSLVGDIHYLFSDFFGLGAKYSFFSTSAHKEFTIKLFTHFPQYYCLEMEERLYIHYAGPSVMFRQRLDANRKLQLTEAFSAGYVHYRDEIRIGSVEGLINGLAKSNTWGANVGLYFDYFPVPWLSVGVNTDFMYARLTKVDFSTKETTETIKYDKKDEYEYLTRLDYTFSIRFHF